MTEQSEEIGDRVRAWFGSRLPSGWLAGSGVGAGAEVGAEVEIEVDQDEILLVLRLADRLDPAEFRRSTRDERINIARQAEETFGRRVSWGTRSGGTRRLFTTVRTVVAAALAMNERRVLDSLVAAGVAADRSDAVAWCIRLVGRHEADWLADLRDGLAAAGPGPVERTVQI